MPRIETQDQWSFIFPVDNVVPATNPIPTEALADHLARRFRRQVLFLPDSLRRVVNCSLKKSAAALSDEDRAHLANAESYTSRVNPLIDAVATAFSEHRPLTLSPDCVWMAIEQGFAHHVAANAEALRGCLVKHQRTQELTCFVFEISLPAFESAIACFSAQIREATNPVLHETLICDFSTTTPAIRTASEVVLMDAYSPYFEYLMMCICGIPKVTVLGSLDDWQRIRARIEVFEAFGLGWWVARLRPILDEFVRTAEGRPNQVFWQAIYKPKQAYGTESVTGWIADLFPYLGDSPRRTRSHVFDYEREDWALPVDRGVQTMGGEPGADKGVGMKRFPSGLASVPLRLILPDGIEGKVDLVAGFLAVEQDPADLALAPVIGWSVTEPAPAAPVMAYP